MKAYTPLIALLALMLSTIFTVSAQEQEQKEFTGSLLWKISGNGLSQPSYILGTHHLFYSGFVDSIPGLRSVTDEAQQTIGELDMSDVMELQTKIRERAMLPAGVTYNDLLSPEDYKILDEGLKVLLGAGLDKMETVHPGIISLTLSALMYMKANLDFDPAKFESIDQYMQRIARENGKEVFGLESAEEQLNALLDTDPLKDQAEALVCTISTFDGVKKQLDKLNNYYRTGNLTEIYNLFHNPDEPCKTSQEQKSALNKNRNDAWVAKLPAMMKEKSSLVVVGALHISGKDGILYQLAERGYKVEPVK